MILYCHPTLKEEIINFQSKIGVSFILRDVKDLWDIDFVDRLYFDVLKENVVVINPEFNFFVTEYFGRFLEESRGGGVSNYFYSPKLNPNHSLDKPVWLFIKKIDSVYNFLVETLYRNNQITLKFRNIMHKGIRGNSISRTDIPKYLTNLDSDWKNYENIDLSKWFMESFCDKCFPSPTNIHVAISNRCNLECVMCPYHSPKYQDMHRGNFFDKANYMKEDDFRKVAQYCGKHKSFLQFGQLDEPLLHPHFCKFLDIAKESGVEWIHLTTNGTLLTKEIADKIVHSNIRHINFSLDAIDEQSYMEIRGSNYQDTLGNIEYLLEKLKEIDSKITTSVCFILQGENAKEKSQKFLNYWIKKVNKVKFHQLTEYELRNEILCSKHEESFRDQQKERYTCSIPWNVLFVLPDSRVTFCCNSMAEYATSTCGCDNTKHKAYIGDLSRETLEQIWTGKNMKKLRQELMANKFEMFDICKRCNSWSAGELSANVDTIDGIKVKIMYSDSEAIYEKE